MLGPQFGAAEAAMGQRLLVRQGQFKDIQAVVEEAKQVSRQ